jgi:hypothetical protein
VPLPLQIYPGIVYQLVYNRFLPDPLLFVLHLSELLYDWPFTAKSALGAKSLETHDQQLFFFN